MWHGDSERGSTRVPTRVPRTRVPRTYVTALLMIDKYARVGGDDWTRPKKKSSPERIFRNSCAGLPITRKTRPELTGPSLAFQATRELGGFPRSGSTMLPTQREEVFHGQDFELVGRNARLCRAGRRTSAADGGFRRVRNARFRRAQRGAGETGL